MKGEEEGKERRGRREKRGGGEEGGGMAINLVRRLIIFLSIFGIVAKKQSETNTVQATFAVKCWLIKNLVP